MSECVMHGCHETARWAVGAAKTELCAKHMIDSVAEVGFGNVVATRLPPADIVDELRHVADLLGDRGVGSVGVAVDALLDRAANEIERLRMTADEVGALKALLHQVEVYSPQWAGVLRGLLERTK